MIHHRDTEDTEKRKKTLCLRGIILVHGGQKADE